MSDAELGAIMAVIDCFYAAKKQKIVEVEIRFCIITVQFLWTESADI